MSDRIENEHLGQRSGGATVAVFPATFDPITNGHVSLADRIARHFDRLVLGVYAHGPHGSKSTLFSTTERVGLCRRAIHHIRNAEVVAFEGLAVDLARSQGASALVRGLRVADDFEFERQMAMMNRHLAPEIETFLLIADPEHAFVSATIVREVGMMGGDVSGMVPPPVAEALSQRRSERRTPERNSPSMADEG